jgi:hypothetical protein
VRAASQGDPIREEARRLVKTELLERLERESGVEKRVEEGAERQVVAPTRARSPSGPTPGPSMYRSVEAYPECNVGFPSPLMKCECGPTKHG